MRKIRNVAKDRTETCEYNTTPYDLNLFHLWREFTKMLSEVNEADYLQSRADCCRCCAQKTTSCICQACHDG